MNGAEPGRGTPHRRVFLLSSQGFALGLTTAWITIPASAIFLGAYGSGLLPVTYIAAAAAGVVSSIVLAAALRRRPLASVATGVLAGLTVTLLASWAVLSSSDADWVSFALVALVPIVVPVGFIFVVGQAGMLLDVRSLKTLYARVVAGFALGFVAGGLAGPLLLTLLGNTENVLAAAAAAAALFLALVAWTKRSYPAQLSVIEHTEEVGDGPTLRALSRNRYVMLIVAFQMLSALASQLLDFNVLASAVERYDDTNQLATFLSRFSAIVYGSDLLFLLLLAGLLLHRFGLRYGLTANSIGVVTVLAAIIVATAVSGSGATIVFVLIVAARVTDLTFSDGSSRTSLSAAYQAVPTRLRAIAQATVEGLAVPVAIGASGVVLLVVQSAGRIDGLVLPGITAVVVLVWLVVASLVYRAYRVNLLANLRGRTLDTAALSIDDESSLLVIDRLVESADERDVRLGLDVLTAAEHPELPTRLQHLVTDDRVGVRTDALERLARVAPELAAVSARDGLDDPSTAVRSASIRVLGRAGDAGDRSVIATHSTDSAPDVKVAVVFALTRLGDDPVGTEIADEIVRLAHSGSADDRILAALMLGEVEPGRGIDRTTLRTLLGDADVGVVNAALGVLHWPDDAELLTEVVAHLDHRHTTGAAVDAMVRAGDAALAVVDDALCSNEHGRHAHELLVRVSREIGDAPAIAVLRGHVNHRDREVGLAVMRALAALGPSGGSPAGAPGSDHHEPDLTEPVVRQDLEHATYVVRALVAFEHEPAATLQCSALRDELDLVQQRVLAAFSMRHGTEGFNRVVFQLAQRDARSHALALEWLDVTLTGTDRAAVAMLEPRWSDRERLNALSRTFPLPLLTQREVLLDLVQDPDDRWRRPWITACAIYTASRMSEAELEAIAAAAGERSATSGVDDPEHIVHETLAGVRRRS